MGAKRESVSHDDRGRDWRETKKDEGDHREARDAAPRSEARRGAALHCAFRGHPPYVKSGGRREGCLLSSHPPGGDSLLQSWESEALEEKERSPCFCSSPATAAGWNCTSFTLCALRAGVSVVFNPSEV